VTRDLREENMEMEREGGGLLVWWEGFLRRRLGRRADDDGDETARVASDGDEVNMLSGPVCRGPHLFSFFSLFGFLSFERCAP